MKPAFRTKIYERSNGYCERCEQGLPESWAAHHRKLRAQGGKDEYVNVVALCHQCHNLGTASVHLNPAQAVDAGYIVPGWADPASTPICPSGGQKLLLLTDGTKQNLGE